MTIKNGFAVGGELSAAPERHLCVLFGDARHIDARRRRQHSEPHGYELDLVERARRLRKEVA
jgi:hypothetical protein